MQSTAPRNQFNMNMYSTKMLLPSKSIEAKNIQHMNSIHPVKAFGT